MKLNLEIDSKKAIPWIIVAVLCGLLIWSLCVDSGEPTVVTERTTDTLVVTKVDTMEITKVVTKVEKEPADTVYLTVRDSILVPVPRQEYTFSKPDMFDFKVKGFEVEFLEANVYPKTVYKTITNETTTTITKYKSSLFVFGGFSWICGDFSPKVGVSLSLKGKWLISGDFGLYGKEPIYGLSVGYNVLNR